jgi:hypothetical protein
MPQWRKLHTKVVESIDVNSMPDDFTRLLWVLLPTQLCREGRGQDSPAWVRARVFPLRDDVTLDMVEAALAWFAGRGMIARYQVDGRPYFQVVNWARYQGNTSRETASDYPPPPALDPDPPRDAPPAPAEVPPPAGPTPAEVPPPARPAPAERPPAAGPPPARHTPPARPASDQRVSNSRVTHEHRATNSRLDADANADADADRDANADADPDIGASAPPPSPLNPEGPGQELLFARLAAEYDAQKRRRPTRFRSMACKAKFTAAEARLSLSDLEIAINRGLEKGILSIDGLTDWVARWQPGAVPRASPAGLGRPTHNGKISALEDFQNWLAEEELRNGKQN